MTSCVNVKVKYIRPKYSNLKTWCDDPDNIYIGRRGIVFIKTGDKKERYPKKDSYWANPFKVTKKLSREESIELYRDHIAKKLAEDGWDKLKDLRGKNLGCWCHPDACHGDVLVDMIASLP